MKMILSLLGVLILVLSGCSIRTAAPAARFAELPVQTSQPAPLNPAPEREPRIPTRSAEVVPARPPAAATGQRPPAIQPRRSDPPAQIPVLLYHDLAPGARGGNGVTVDVAEFEQQMAWLAQNGYTPVSTADLLAWLHGKGQLPPRPVQIQFDDGYRSNFTYALPIMKKHGMKAALFLVSGFPDELGGDAFVSWAQVKAMAASGVFEIQGHTHAGHSKTGTVANLVAWDSDRIRADYRTMAERFADAGLPAPRTFAYPFGAHDDETVSALRAEGAEAAFTVQHGYVRRGDDPFRLKRLIVWPGMSGCQFAGLVQAEAACQ